MSLRARAQMQINQIISMSATKFHGRFLVERRVKVLADNICSMMPTVESILDVGCGNGRLAQEILRRMDIKTLHGIDVVASNNIGIPVTSYDGSQIPFDDNSWDLVMANDVLHHCNVPYESLCEICRVSRRYVVIKDHIANCTLDGKLLRLMDWIGNHGYGVPLPYNYLSSDEWMNAFQNVGLDVANQISKLDLYPKPFSWIFDRNLHFIALLEKRT